MWTADTVLSARAVSSWSDSHTFITWLPDRLTHRSAQDKKTSTHGRMMEKQDVHRLTSGKETPVCMSYHQHWSAELLYDTESWWFRDDKLCFVCRNASQLYASARFNGQSPKTYNTLILFGFLLCLRASRLVTMLHIDGHREPETAMGGWGGGGASKSTFNKKGQKYNLMEVYGLKVHCKKNKYIF